ncbi:hypothetical protein BCV70DRAFT_197543 [Testicularia cyperi]|uniref:Uncharacterized protein n=1 Tax=Testicularia cyperi TaxID=1882483 RepID=A0A317XZU3_9BASI|nr:hypothetical protein BCV70DRAFT_197543 [Testicularia cyperi]
MARPTSSDDDATPFLLRVCVKPTPFRPLAEFEDEARPSRDEYKLYVWKSHTLRDIAHMLYDVEPSISTPLALHAFRVVGRDGIHGPFVARDIGIGVTRVPIDSICDLLKDPDTDNSMREDSNMAVDDEGITQGAQATDTTTRGTRSKASEKPIIATLGLDLLRDEVDEDAAQITISQLDLRGGEFLDCVVKADPSRASRPSAGPGSGSRDPFSSRSRR